MQNKRNPEEALTELTKEWFSTNQKRLNSFNARRVSNKGKKKS